MTHHAKKRLAWLLGGGAMLLVAGHGITQNLGDGLILAKVGDDRVTEAMVAFEMGGGKLPPPLQSAAHTAALQGLIARKLMVQEALRQKLDATPDGAMALRRADDLAMVALLEQSLTARLPAIDEVSVTRFIATHPASFARRKRIAVDQVQASNVDADTIRQIGALDRLEDITALLDRVSAEYVRTANVLDTLDMEPKAAAQIAALKKDAVFITPRASGALEITRIRNSETAPVANDAARIAARRYLEHAQKSAVAKREMAKIVAAGQKSVRINPQYR